MLDLNNPVVEEKINHKFTLKSYMTSLNMRKENGISKMTNETREFVERNRQQNYLQQDNEIAR